MRRRSTPAGVMLAGALSILALLSSCATTVPEAPRPHIPQAEAPYLLDPLVDYRMAVAAGLEARIHQAFGVLRSGGDLAASKADAEAMLAEDPGFHPAQVLLAQIAFLGGDAARARDLLVPVADEQPEYLACHLLLGRVAEDLDDPLLAFQAYRSASESSSLARERAARLEPRATDITAQRIRELIDRGHLEEARGELEVFETWASDEVLVLEVWRDWALDEGDIEREMVVLERLHDLDPDDETLPERLADLYLISGEVQAAIELLEELVPAGGGDPRLVEKLERAKFSWRLQLLPEHVRDIASKSVLSRSELATLLYWLVPAVRYAEVTDPPIATDILDHPRRQEILPVMFLGLVPVDETLHRFSPEEPATRVLTLRALLGLVRLAESEIACLDLVELEALGRSPSLTCRKAAECRLIPEQADCLPLARISGPDARDLFRRTLDLLGSG